MKYLFFLLIIPFLSIPSAFGYTGPNYDLIELGDGKVQWSSHYERVLDNNWKWKNYIVTDSANFLSFQSSGLVYTFDKINCHFVLYDPKDNTKSIDAYQFNLSIDGLPVPLPVCNIQNLIQNENDISFTVDNSIFQTHYNLNPVSGVEWTHDLSNTLGKAALFNIQEICKGCTIQNIDGNIIDFGTYKLDTKNDQHNTVKDIRAVKTDTVLELEKLLNDKESFLIDPVFTSVVSGDGNQRSITSDADTTCNLTHGASSAALDIFKPASISNDYCWPVGVAWDISSIPDTASIENIYIEYDVTAIFNPINCTWRATDATLFDSTTLSDAYSGTIVLKNDSTCTTVGDGKSISLNSNGTSALTNDLAGNTFTLMVFFHDQVRDGSGHTITFRASDAILTVTYDSVAAVTDLTATDVRGSAVDLSWTAPAANVTITGYQINKTNPWSSNVNTIHYTTSSTATTYTAYNLDGETQYSFRIKALPGGEVSNIVNVTTLYNPTTSFTPGTFDLNFTGDDIRSYKFDRDDIDATTLRLNVTYSNTYNTTCSFYFKFAANTLNYSNLSTTPVNANEDMASFTFNDVDNEIINVHCFDEDSTAEGNYLITQTFFPLLEMVSNFRNGTYGTQGQFGALDFITVIAVIASMIGFNRVNETVGIVFGLFMIGALAVLSNGEIISWASTFSVGFAVLIMYAITSTRKD